MSRMTALAIMLLFASPALAGPTALETYQEKTAANPRCKAAEGAEITVCGRREADKYRVPLVVPTPGDPKLVNVPLERAKLIATESPCQTRGPFLVGCGAVGVSVSTKLGTGKVEYRPIAP